MGSKIGKNINAGGGTSPLSPPPSFPRSPSPAHSAWKVTTKGRTDEGAGLHGSFTSSSFPPPPPRLRKEEEGAGIHTCMQNENLSMSLYYLPHRHPLLLDSVSRWEIYGWWGRNPYPFCHQHPPAGGGEGRRGEGTLNCKAKMEAVEEEEGGSTVGGRSEFETGKTVRAYRGRKGERYLHSCHAISRSKAQYIRETLHIFHLKL